MTRRLVSCENVHETRGTRQPQCFADRSVRTTTTAISMRCSYIDTLHTHTNSERGHSWAGKLTLCPFPETQSTWNDAADASYTSLLKTSFLLPSVQNAESCDSINVQPMSKTYSFKNTKRTRTQTRYKTQSSTWESDTIALLSEVWQWYNRIQDNGLGSNARKQCK